MQKQWPYFTFGPYFEDPWAYNPKKKVQGSGYLLITLIHAHTQVPFATIKNKINVFLNMIDDENDVIFIFIY